MILQTLYASHKIIELNAADQKNEISELLGNQKNCMINNTTNYMSSLQGKSRILDKEPKLAFQPSNSMLIISVLLKKVRLDPTTEKLQKLTYKRQHYQKACTQLNCPAASHFSHSNCVNIFS